MLTWQKTNHNIHIFHNLRNFNFFIISIISIISMITITSIYSIISIISLISLHTVLSVNLGYAMCLWYCKQIKDCMYTDQCFSYLHWMPSPFVPYHSDQCFLYLHWMTCLYVSINICIYLGNVIGRAFPLQYQLCQVGY